MSFPLNHIFKKHSSYIIEYKHLIINVEINNTIIIDSKAYFQHSTTNLTSDFWPWKIERFSMANYVRRGWQV